MSDAPFPSCSHCGGWGTHEAFAGRPCPKCGLHYHRLQVCTGPCGKAWFVGAQHVAGSEECLDNTDVVCSDLEPDYGVKARIRAHWLYLKYVLRHKRFVYSEGRKLGVGRLQLVAHDFQKFMPAEWSPYVYTFYGPKESPRRKDGGYDPNAVSTAFDLAWLHHQKVGGKHHWQYWVLPLDDGGTRALTMPDKYRREMVADWRGAGRAQGKPDTVGWYEANRHNMTLHADTRAWVEKEIGYV